MPELESRLRNNPALAWVFILVNSTADTGSVFNLSISWRKAIAT